MNNEHHGPIITCPNCSGVYASTVMVKESVKTQNLEQECKTITIIKWDSTDYIKAHSAGQVIKHNEETNKRKLMFF